jgi:hypothetical protein
MKKIAAEDNNDAEVTSPFSKNKKTKAKLPKTVKMRSTHESTMPPSQNLFGRLIQTMNAANTQNVRDNNPGWDIYAAVERAAKVFEKNAILAHPGDNTGVFGAPDTAGWKRWAYGTGFPPPPPNPLGRGTGLDYTARYENPITRLLERIFGRPRPELLMKMSEGKVKKVMGEFKRGKLRSGSKTGPKVKSRDQAIAIALSEAREAGEDVPEKKSEVRTMKISEFSKLAAEITAKKRKNLPKSDFGLKNKADTKKEKSQSGNYPIDTEGRARAALAYSKRYASPGQQATIKKRVEAKYPKMEVKAEDAYMDGVIEKLAEAGFTEKEAQGFMESLGEMMGARPGEGLMEMAGRRMMAMPRWLGKNPGKAGLAALGIPLLAAPLLGGMALGRMFPRKQTMWERLRGGASDLGAQIRGLF